MVDAKCEKNFVRISTKLMFSYDKDERPFQRFIS